jgi:NAD(P)-dependent dehydrogenase (short-subunit alcohol dehydrogenase family)
MVLIANISLDELRVENVSAADRGRLELVLPIPSELDADRIRVVAVARGFINMPILGKAMKESLAKQHLHGKLIEPERVASVVAFLFTEGASAINGSTIPVEDGFQIFKNS